MIAVRYSILSLGLTLSLGAGASAESRATTGGRPLPHQDILTLPAEAPTQPAAPAAPAIPEPAQAAVAETTPDPRESKQISPAGSATGLFAGEAREGKTVERNAATRPGLVSDLWPLLAVLLLIATVAFVLKRFMPSRRMLAGSQVLQIVAQTPLTSKQQLTLVKLGRRLVLLGVSPDRVNALSTIDDPEQVSMLLGDLASSQDNSISRAFVESMQEEADAYADFPDDDGTRSARGQVRGLLSKVRALAGKPD